MQIGLLSVRTVGAACAEPSSSSTGRSAALMRQSDAPAISAVLSVVCLPPDLNIDIQHQAVAAAVSEQPTSYGEMWLAMTASCLVLLLAQVPGMLQAAASKRIVLCFLESLFGQALSWNSTSCARQLLLPRTYFCCWCVALPTTTLQTSALFNVAFQSMLNCNEPLLFHSDLCPWR